MAEKAKHAFGALERIDEAISSGKIDAYDMLFVKDANGKPYVGWVDANGEKVIVEEKDQIIRVEELPTENGDEDVVYIYNNDAYIWNGTQCKPLCQPTDLTELEAEVAKKLPSSQQV